MEPTLVTTEPAVSHGHRNAPWPATTVLLVEADAASAKAVQDGSDDKGGIDFSLEWVTTLEDATARLAWRDIEVVLLGLPVPGCQTAEAIAQLRRAAPTALVLPLGDTGSDPDGVDMAQGEALRDRVAQRRTEISWLPETLRYITQQKAAQTILRTAAEALHQEQEQAQVTLRAIGDAVLICNLEGHVTYLNPTAQTLTGWTRAEATGEALSEVFNVIDSTSRQPSDGPARRAMQENTAIGLSTNRILRRRDGNESGIEDSAAPIHDRQGKVSGAVIVFRDISQSRTMTRKMAYLAQHDALTGLANRALFTERLGQAILRARRHRRQAALLFVDLDHFKDINDSLGHVVGDQVLQCVARTLSNCVRTTDTVCRLGGDEFVILLAEIEKPEDAVQVAEKIVAAFAEPLNIDDHDLHVQMSIGISVYPDDGGTVNALMQHADTAMYQAKANDSHNGHLSRADRNRRPLSRDAPSADLQEAFDRGEFLLHYQPQIDVATGQVIGVEALVRWQHREHGLIYPNQFMPAVEQSGLIDPIGHWIFREACRQVSVWHDTGLTSLRLAINVSLTEFMQPEFVSRIAQALCETSVVPESIELEVTESMLMQDPVASAVKLKALRDIGLHIAIDDFGTGHSSLSSLRRFPINTLKVDKSFMRDVDTDRGSAVILRSLISLGRNLGHRVVAEGVETVQQLGFLKAQQCDVAQGFQLGHPLDADDFSLLLASRYQTPLWQQSV